MSKLMDDPKHWRRRAGEARAISGEMMDTMAANTMLEIATKYESIAEQIEARLAYLSKPAGESS